MAGKRRLSKKHKDFLETEDPFPVDAKFVVKTLLPSLEKELGRFGDGWIKGPCEIHTREIQALIDFICNRCS